MNDKLEAENLLQENHPGAIGFHKRLGPGQGCGAWVLRTLTEIFIIMSGGKSARGFDKTLTAGEIQDFSLARVAEITDFKTGTVKFRLFRAHERLRAEFWNGRFQRLCSGRMCSAQA